MTDLAIGYQDFFVPGEGRRVRVASDHGTNRVALIISNRREGVPRSVLVRCRGTVGILNFAGATSIKDAAERQRLFWYIASMFGGNPDMPFKAASFCAISGGTRVIEQGLSSGDPTGTMTIVEAPGLVHRLNPQVRTAGHAPRTSETLGYEGDHSSFSLVEEADAKTIANPDIHMLWLVQKNATDPSEWDGDLEVYLDLLLTVKEADAGESGQFFWSGGGVTGKEIWGSLTRGIPGLLLRGSGRIVDSAIHAFDNQWGKVTEGHELLEQILADTDAMANVDQMTVVDSTNPLEGQRWLQNHGFGVML